jgi:membrane-associated PAP2 superfamily phosphatase
VSYARVTIWLLLATSLAQAIFATVPALDLWVSGLFYDPARGFWLRDAAAIHRLRSVMMGAVWVVGLPALLLALMAGIGRGRYRLGARPWLFVAGGLVLGPGLLVNGLLKETWGRARPADVAQFGGEAAFTPPFQITDQCLRNCSFTSGEAASAATLAMLGLALAWPGASRQGRWLLVGILVPIALAAGGLRVAMGRHFLSDVVFSVLLCALVLLILHRALGLGRRPAIRLADLGADLRAAVTAPAALPRRLAGRKARIGRTDADQSPSRHQTSGSHPVQSP